MPVYITPPPRNPLTQVLAAIVGILAMIGAFLFGLVTLAVIAGIAALVGIAAWYHAWRLRRQIRRNVKASSRTGRGEVIEAEYTVVSRKRENN